MMAAAKKKNTDDWNALTSTFGGRTAIVMAAMRAVLQMMEPMALP